MDYKIEYIDRVLKMREILMGCLEWKQKVYFTKELKYK